tara:strand:- start:746 stop:874 length:129 start_codon:yes stop_codon:yes gene_type:complete
MSIKMSSSEYEKLRLQEAEIVLNLLKKNKVRYSMIPSKTSII